MKHLSKGEINTRTGIPRTTINDIIARGEEDQAILRTARPQRRKEFKIPDEKVLEIEKDMDGDWGRGSMTSEELIQEYNLDCWPQTLLNAFKRVGIGHFWAAQDKFLTQKNKDERKTYAYEVHNVLKRRLPQWKKVLFSDACHFAVNQARKKKVFRRKGRDPKTSQLYRNRLDKTQKRKAVQKVSTSVAAMVGWNFKSHLVLIPRHINGDDYIKSFLDPIVRPFFEKQRKEGVFDWVFEEDNEGAHGTMYTLNAPNDCKNHHRITMMRPGQPANSGDLSPIENVWKTLKQRVKKRKATSQAQLREFIFEEWDKITIQEINKHISNMEDRMLECLDRKGNVTSF